MPWYVLYTKPRNEKKLAQELAKAGFEVYCPILTIEKQWSDRKKKVEEPVFKSYVFVQLDNYAKSRTLVLTFPGAVCFLFWLGKPGVVLQQEIDVIRELLDNTIVTNVCISPAPGDNVVVKNGPFKDQVGSVVKVKENIVTLSIPSIGWKVMIETKVEDVEAKKKVLT